MAMGTAKRKVGSWVESGYLGRGTFGMVMLWYNEETKEKIALKTCRNDPPLSEKNRERWKQEVEFLKWIKHPNIIETRELPKELVNGECYEEFLPALCMEYCEGGDLRKTLSTAENCCGLTETMVVRVCVDIASAIECLHKENIAHRDLKPENIVICPGANKNVYKVIDLGYAKQADQSGLCHSIVGTHYYLAPEIVNGQKYTPKVDLWSYGILLYECCTGVRPFPKVCKEIYQSMGSKEVDFIAVTFEEDDTLVYCKKLPEVNRLNSVLKKKFEELLHLLLDVNPSRRGSRETETGKRSWRDCVLEIQKTKVIEVFCVELCKQLFYELTSNLSLQDLQRCLERDTGIPCDHQELFVADGSNLTSLPYANQNLTAFVCDKRFRPNLRPQNKPEIPCSLCKMLEDPEAFSKRSTKRHLEVYRHSVFFINKQIINNKCLIRCSMALVIRLLKWSRDEFTVKSSAVKQRVTELSSVVSFFDQSLQTDLKYFDTKCSANKNGLSKDFPDFEAWRRVKKEMDISNIMREAEEIFKLETSLQNKIAAMKKSEHTKTRELSKIQLTQWAQEIYSRYDHMKASLKNPEEKSPCWKNKIELLLNCIKMVLGNVENFNEEFYEFLRELFILRQELKKFIPILESLETKTMEHRQKMQEWQQSRQEQIWQLLSGSKNQAEKSENSETSAQQKSVVTSRRRTSAAEIVKQSQVLVSRVENTLRDVKHKQEMFKSKMEDLDWSFCNISDSEDSFEIIKDT